MLLQYSVLEINQISHARVVKSRFPSRCYDRSHSSAELGEVGSLTVVSYRNRSPAGVRAI